MPTRTLASAVAGGEAAIDPRLTALEAKPAPNLTITPAASTVTLDIAGATGDMLPAATTSNAGVMTAADKTKLNGIEAGAQVNPSSAQVVSMIDDELGSEAWLAPAGDPYEHPNHSGDVTSVGDGVTTIANGAVTPTKMSNAAKDFSIVVQINGDGATIPTGVVPGDFSAPFSFAITGWTLLADQSGSAVVDIWKNTYANYPPVSGNKITASAPPTISSTTKATSSTLTGWTTTIAAGDILRFNVNSAATIQALTLVLNCRRT